METIIYQGHQIKAKLVNRISGILTIATFPTYSLAHDGDEDLFRDGGGQYYLRRRLKWLDFDGDTARPASRRVFVHRLSLRTAILWTTMRANPESPSLRRDAFTALHAPASLNAARRFADGSMALTLHLAPRAARFFRAACELDERDPVTMVYTATELEVRSSLEAHGRDDDGINHAFAFNAPEILLENNSGVTLDEQARTLVERFASDWSSKTADVVNGALHFCLEAEYGTGQSRTLLEAIDALAGRRLGFIVDRKAEGERREAMLRHHGINLEPDEEDDEPAAPTSRRHAGNAADVALLAAAEPEAFEDLPPEQRGEAKPIRAVLLELVEDWRTQAAEARTQDTDLASAKLHGQADLLEQCAAAIETTLNAEEGK